MFKSSGHSQHLKVYKNCKQHTGFHEFMRLNYWSFFFSRMKALYSDTWYCTATASFSALYCTIRKRTAVASSLLSSTHVCLFLICLFTLKIALLKRWCKTQSINRMSCVSMKQRRLMNPTCTSHLHIKITLHLHDEGRGTNTRSSHPPPPLSLSLPAVSERPSKTFYPSFFNLLLDFCKPQRSLHSSPRHELRPARKITLEM